MKSPLVFSKPMFFQKRFLQTRFFPKPIFPKHIFPKIFFFSPKSVFAKQFCCQNRFFQTSVFPKKWPKSNHIHFFFGSRQSLTGDREHSLCFCYPQASCTQARGRAWPRKSSDRSSRSKKVEKKSKAEKETG